MTRAVRVWAAETDTRRDFIRRVADQWGFAALVHALDADLAVHTAPPFNAFQAPLFAERDAGPRLTPKPAHCRCGEEVTTELTAWVTGNQTVIWLGPACWAKRSLGRAAAAAGEQLQIGET